MLKFGRVQASNWGFKMKNYFAFLLILALCLSAQANVISFTDSITGLFDQVETRDLVVPQFDSSLGTLNSVSVNVSTAIQGSVGFENLKRFTGGNFAVTVNVHGYVALDYMVMSNYQDQQNYNVILGAYDGALDYAGTSGTILATYSDADNMQYTIGYDFSRFLGTSNVIFSVLAEAVADHIAKPANSSADLLTTGQASVTVTYDYSPVPEPATIVVLSIAGLFLRRRKA
jgi:hypothetical protein